MTPHADRDRSEQPGCTVRAHGHVTPLHERIRELFPREVLRDLAAQRAREAGV